MLAAGAAPPTGRTLSGWQARSDVCIRLPASREASFTSSSRCGTPRPQLLLPGWLAKTLVRGGSIDMGLFLAAASMVLVVSQFMRRHHSC